jgi:murein DD-endopeptidase MepM/ murein hydrolase activator NlpD
MPSFALRPFVMIAAVTALAVVSFAGWLVGGAAGSRAAVPVASARSAAPHPATVARQTAAATRIATRASRSHRREGLWFRPARGPVTSGYGRRWGTFHPGIDIGAHYGSPVRAITGGRIVSAGWITGYGNTIRIRSGHMVFYYPHLSRIVVHHGSVAAGERIGKVGSTGYSTGPHLHVEIREHGHPANPGPILRRHGVRL